MAGKTMMMKTKWYPQPHRENNGFLLSADTAAKQATIVPIAFYDEGLGEPSAQETHPENAAFVAVARGNCFVESRINLVLARLQFSLTKGALETDKVHAMNIQFMPIFMSFKEDYIAIDELSSSEIQDVLEMQTETTDRQGFPLYTTTKLTEKFAGSATLDAAQPGLT